MKIMMKRRSDTNKEYKIIQPTSISQKQIDKEKSYEEAKIKIFNSSSNKKDDDNIDDESIKWIKDMNFGTVIVKEEHDVEYTSDQAEVVSKLIQGKGINPEAKPFIPKSKNLS